MNVVQSFSNQGTPIDILQVGNEINDGLLWPTGQVSKNGYHPLSELHHSAINGAKAVGSPKILIHLANGWNWSGLDAWFSGVYVPGALSADQVDIIGVSFYPFYDAGATLAALKTSLTNAANTFGKPIVVAETDWPVSCSGTSLTEPSIAVSTSGQQTWVNDIKNVLAGLPSGRGQGICMRFPSCAARNRTDMPGCSLLGAWLDRKRQFGVVLRGLSPPAPFLRAVLKCHYSGQSPCRFIREHTYFDQHVQPGYVKGVPQDMYAGGCGSRFPPSAAEIKWIASSPISDRVSRPQTSDG